MENRHSRILIVDDEPGMRLVLSKELVGKGYMVDTASNIAESREFLNEFKYLLIFLDIILPDGSGLEFLEMINNRPNAPSVVVMTAEATMDNAITAMGNGAFDYLTKPFDLDTAGELADKVAEYSELCDKQKSESLPKRGAFSSDELIGKAPAMQEVFKLIGRLANSGLTVLVTGPTGSGKELVARALGRNSSRARGPFVTVNCAAIPGELLESELFGHVKGAFTGAVENKKGKFLMADMGTILLDEVGDMPHSLQAKMLRVLQEKEFYPVGGTKSVRVDTRVIASTNRDLEQDALDGRFREDLYHRLNVAGIHLPSLSRRREDIPALVSHFLTKIAKGTGGKPMTITPDTLDALTGYDWPGNVRELENVVHRAAFMAPGSMITTDHLPPEFSNSQPQHTYDTQLASAVRNIMLQVEEGKVHETVMKIVESVLIETALKQSGAVQTRAARILGINRNTITKKIKELALGSDTPESV